MSKKKLIVAVLMSHYYEAQYKNAVISILKVQYVKFSVELKCSTDCEEMTVVT